MIELELSNEDRTKISALARECKFTIDGAKTEFIYALKSTEKLNHIINAIRFFTSISNHMQIEESIRTSFSNYIKQKEINDFYNEALILFYQYEHNSFGRYMIVDKIDKFLIKNNSIINNIIDIAFMLGRNVKTFDPDENQGVY